MGGLGKFLKNVERETKKAAQKVERESRRAADDVAQTAQTVWHRGDPRKVRHFTEDEFYHLRDFANLYKRTAKAKALLGLENCSELSVDLEAHNLIIPFDKYTINYGNEVGSGAQGKVYTAIYEKELVAVKVTSNSREADDLVALTSLQHPNVVRFIGRTNISLNHYILMEFCDQGELFAVLRRRDLDKESVFDFAAQIASGMEYVHERNIVHRDLKSKNILVNSENVLKICDFGHHRSNVVTGTVMSKKGTLHWVAPEILNGGRSSKKIDIWSYGVILHELIFCFYPTIGFLEVEVGARIISPEGLIPLIPASIFPELKGLLDSCLQVDPSCRPTFTALKHLLENTKNQCRKYSDSLFTRMQQVGRAVFEQQRERLEADNLSTSGNFGGEQMR